MTTRTLSRPVRVKRAGPVGSPYEPAPLPPDRSPDNVETKPWSHHDAGPACGLTGTVTRACMGAAGGCGYGNCPGPVVIR